ncbi:MAG: thioredoxin-like domain-containing protein [Bacteroidota bacterium]
MIINFFKMKWDMRNYKRFFWIVIFVLFGSNIMAQQEHKIEVQVKGVSDTTMLLGHHFGKKKYVVDTVMADENGRAVFEGDEPLDRGIYIVVLPSENNAYFEMLIGDDQKFSLTTDKEDFVNNMKIKGSKANKVFNEYQRKMSELQNKIKQYRSELESAEDDSVEKQKIKDKMGEVTEERKAYIKEMAEEHEGTLFGSIVKAVLEPEIPEPPKDEEGNIVDSTFEYRYLRDHYFDNIDFSEPGLLRTPILESKIDYFFKKMMPPVADSVRPVAHDLIERAQEANEEMFRYMTSHLLNHFETSKVMGMDEVFIDIAEKWYLSGEAEWADSTLIEKIRERVLKITPNIIGKVASDIAKVPTFNDQFASLHKVDADYTILVFYEPNCGHCKKIVPRLYELYQDTLQDANVEVFAMYTQADKEEWTEFLEKHELFDWINAYDPYGRTNFRDNYDIYSTPVIYILDDEKRIVAKRIDIEYVPEFIKYDKKRKKKEAEKNSGDE